MFVASHNIFCDCSSVSKRLKEKQKKATHMTQIT